MTGAPSWQSAALEKYFAIASESEGLSQGLGGMYARIGELARSKSDIELNIFETGQFAGLTGGFTDTLTNTRLRLEGDLARVTAALNSAIASRDALIKKRHAIGGTAYRCAELLVRLKLLRPEDI